MIGVSDYLIRISANPLLYMPLFLISFLAPPLSAATYYYYIGHSNYSTRPGYYYIRHGTGALGAPKPRNPFHAIIVFSGNEWASLYMAG